MDCRAASLVLVPVAGVGRMAMTVVRVIDVATMLHGFMPARLVVRMGMRLVHGVALRAAFVLVALMRSVCMAIVQVIGVASVRDRRVPAVRPVLVGMIGVGSMFCCHCG